MARKQPGIDNNIVDMNLTEATELAHSINKREGRFEAAPFLVGRYSLIVLRDRLSSTQSRYPIRNPSSYLKQMDCGSAHVESDPEVQDVLRQWLTGRVVPSGNPIC